MHPLQVARFAGQGMGRQRRVAHEIEAGLDVGEAAVHRLRVEAEIGEPVTVSGSVTARRRVAGGSRRRQ